MRYQGDSNSQSLPPESNALPLGHGLKLFRNWPMPQEKLLLTPSGHESKLFILIWLYIIFINKENPVKTLILA